MFIPPIVYEFEEQYMIFLVYFLGYLLNTYALTILMTPGKKKSPKTEPIMSWLYHLMLYLPIIWSSGICDLHWSIY